MVSTAQITTIIVSCDAPKTIAGVSEISCKELKESSRNISKPRTALLEEGEDDASMSPQVISLSDWNHSSDVLV